MHARNVFFPLYEVWGPPKDPQDPPPPLDPPLNIDISQGVAGLFHSGGLKQDISRIVAA